MRTTVTLDEDVAAEVERLRREEGLAVSAAVNRLARTGMAQRSTDRPPFRQATAPLGARVSLDDVGAVLDLLDEV